jgi:hypothetical protein
VDPRAAPRILTPVLGAACWIQLALVPLLTRRAPWFAWALAPAGLAALAAGARDAAARPPRALALYGVAFPVALAASAVAAVGASTARYDAPGQAVVAATVTAYLAAAAWSWSGARERVGAAVVATGVSEAAPAPAPPLRVAALVALVGVAVALAVAAPLGVSRAAGLPFGRGGAALVRGRLALVSAGALSLAALWTFVAGGALLRRAPSPPRSGARAWFYLCAATVAFAMRYWLDHAR